MEDTTGLSTLTATTTDGSGFVLEKPGEFTLVVGGFGDVPQDAANQDQFDVDSSRDQTHAAVAASGSFDHWVSAGVPDSGSYRVVLRGAEPCQSGLDVVFANRNVASRTCPGDGNGAFSTCSDEPAASLNESDGAAGFLDDDAFLDLVLVGGTTEASIDQVCLGDGNGGVLV